MDLEDEDLYRCGQNGSLHFPSLPTTVNPQTERGRSVDALNARLACSVSGTQPTIWRPKKAAADTTIHAPFLVWFMRPLLNKPLW